MSIKKIIAWGSSLPLALTSVIGLSNSANAAALINFANGDQFNFLTNVQLNASDDAGDLAPGDARIGAPGGDDVVVDILFLPTISGGTTVSANNQIVNATDPLCPLLPLGGAQGCTVDMDPGERAFFTSALGNSGGFEDFNNAPFPGAIGEIRAFDESPDNPTTPGTFLPDSFAFPFISITDPSGRLFEFTLDFYTVDSITPTTGFPAGYFDVDVSGGGRVRQYTDATKTSFIEADYVWAVTAQALNDSGDGNDFDAGDGIFAPTSLSASLITIVGVPEPTGIIGTVAALALGLLTSKKKKS
jgi:hypothetical protein